MNKRAVVITSSTRAANGEYADQTGPVIVDAVRSWGFDVDAATVVPDGAAVGLAISESLAQGVVLIITTGGTGISPSDVTPEQTAPFLTHRLPGIEEALRAKGVAEGVPTAVLSRGLAGIARGHDACLIVNLPGSRGGVNDGLTLLEPVVAHIMEQLAGGGHG